jgi:hypothetical protein
MMKRVTAGAIVLALTALLISGCGIFDPQGTLTLKDLMDGTSDAVNTRTEVEETTEEACNDEVQCVEAYSTAEADYFRFPSRQLAEDFASSLDDGFVVNYFVMDFAGKNASAEHQLWAMQHLAGTWNDYEGSFPNRL